ncbi:MAG TPA: amidohydrolase family protein [Bacteroidia bacterium]
MKINISLSIFLFAAIMQCTAQTNEQLSSADFILREVGVVSMLKAEALENQLVCISKGEITYIGKDDGSKQLNTKAKIINAKGKYIMPGMADMHCHFPDKNEIKKYFALNLMAGVTTLRSMQGNAGHLEYKKPLSFPAPNLSLSAPPILSKKTVSNEYADSLLKKCKSDGFDFVKILYVSDSASFATVMAASKKYSIPVCGHLPKCVSLEYVLQSGYTSIEHMGGQDLAYDKGLDYYKGILLKTKDDNVFHCPTLDWYQVVYLQVAENELKKRVGLELIPDSVKQKWSRSMAEDEAKTDMQKAKEKYKSTQEKQLKALKLMADNNVGLLIGLDAGGTYEVPGYDIIEEMKLYKRAGLSNYQILQAATCNAAKYLHQEKSWGTVETGKNANLVLLSGNPLVDLNAITKPEGVFLHAVYYSAEELKKMTE